MPSADTPRTSTSSNDAARQNYGPTLSYRGQPSSICIKKGKWYDCLRPVPGYRQFGGMGADVGFGALGDTRQAGEEESWCDEGDRSKAPSK